MAAALRISVAISGGRAGRCDSAAVASVALPAAVRRVGAPAASAASAPVRRPLVLARGPSVSSHSRAPSSRVHCAPGLGRGAPRRRSRSSFASPVRSSLSRRLTWWAPRRATLPHPAAWRGRAGRSSRLGRPVPGLPPPLAPREVLRCVRGRSSLFPSSLGRRRGAPVRGGPDRAPPVLAAPDLVADGRGAPDLRFSERVPAGRALPGWPPLPGDRREVDPAAPRVPSFFVGRRAPPPVPADWPRRSAPPPEPPRDEGRPPPPRRPCPPPTDRAARAAPPDRADEARRFGWEEFCGTG